MATPQPLQTKLARLVVGATLALGTLGACTGDDDASPSSTTPDSSTTSPTNDEQSAAEFRARGFGRFNPGAEASGPEGTVANTVPDNQSYEPTAPLETVEPGG